MGRRQDDELDDLLTDLSATLSELQDVLADEDDQHHSRRRYRPPAPSRFLRFTEEYTIPTLISLLETNIRALELFQEVLRLVNGRGRGGTRSRSDERVRTTGRRTLNALDGAFSELQDSLDGEPTNPEARKLLNDARSLREEIDTRLSGSDSKQRTDRTQQDNGVITIDVEDETDTEEGETSSDAGTDVNVEDELDTIKRELQDDDQDTDG